MAFARPKDVPGIPDPNLTTRPSSSASNRNHNPTASNPYKMSSWTPNSSKSANQSMFNDRRELIKKWFNNWSDKQKKIVFKDLFDLTDTNFHEHVHKTVLARHPFPEGVDFTRIISKKLSLKIFGYLNVKELCEASLVSNSWKNIVEEDEIWKVRCLEKNWMLQKEAGKYERATWKRLYSSMNFQQTQTKQYFQPNGFNLTQQQMQLLQQSNGMQNGMQNGGFQNGNVLTGNMQNTLNPLTMSTMMGESSNFALLQQLNNQVSGSRPGTGSTVVEKLDLERPSSKQSIRSRQNSARSSRPRSSRKKNTPRLGTGVEHPPWKGNDKKPKDTRRKNYDGNDSFLKNRPPSPSRTGSARPSSGYAQKLNSRPSSARRENNKQKSGEADVLKISNTPRSQISGQHQPVIANHAINLQTQQANNNQLMLMQMQMQMQNQMNTMNVNSQQNSARKPPMSVSSARDLTGQGFPVMT